MLCGLEPLVISKDSNFVNVGERTNVTGSRKFLKLIENKKYSEPGKYKKDFKTRKNDNTWAKEINLD